MLKLLIVADDFTGALDSGVQFASLGAASKVVTSPAYDLRQAEGLDVLIFDAMSFIPAFPAMSRVTRNHVHYINGVPVAQSMFGADPFEPVRSSDVYEVIASTTDRQGIRVIDAETDSDMMAIAGILGHKGLRLTAGCAGFAGAIAHVLGYHGKPEVPRGMPSGFVMLCGSVNPVTRAQMDYARGRGFVYRALRPEQKLNPTWPGSPECHEAARLWLKEFSSSPAILDANDPSETGRTDDYVKSHNLSIEQVRLNISRAIAGAGKALIDEGLDARLMCVGGDTLLALMEAVGVHELVPVCEEELGVVLTSFAYNGRKYYIMTKSGGFGEKELLVELAGK